MANRRQPGKKPRKENKRNAKPSGHLIVSEGVKTEVNYYLINAKSKVMPD